MACGRCGKFGHNNKTCKEEMKVKPPKIDPFEQFKVRLETKYPGLAERLGSESDTVLGRAYGLSRARVHQMRKRMGNAMTFRKSEIVRAMERLGEREAEIGRVPDRHLARQVGVSTYFIRQLREKKGIAPVRSENTAVLRENEDLIGKLSDADAAAKLGVPVSSVYVYRRDRGISASQPSFRYRRKALGLTREKCEEMAARGLTASQMAEEVGCSTQLLARIRRDLGLIPARVPRKEKPTSKYPWDVWMDGQEHTIVQGVDFDSKMWSMISRIRAHGMEVNMSTSVRHTKDSITFRFFSKELASAQG